MVKLIGVIDGFFFFKQKTAYEIMPSLVGSEMCIRDSLITSLKEVTALNSRDFIGAIRKQLEA